MTSHSINRASIVSSLLWIILQRSLLRFCKTSLISGEGVAIVRGLFASGGANPDVVSAGGLPSSFLDTGEELLIEMKVLAGLIGMFAMSASIRLFENPKRVTIKLYHLL